MSTITKTFPTTYPSIFLDLSKQSSAKIASRFISIGGGFVTHLFLAQLGSTALAAGAPITVITRQFSSFIVGTLFNAAIKMNGKIKTQETKHVGERYQQSLVLATLLTIPAIAFMIFTKPILTGLKQPEDVSEVVQKYFRALVLGFAPSFWTFMAQQLAVGLKKPKVVLASGIFQSIGIIALSYPLMFGKIGFPKMGAAGLGYATGAVSLLNFIALSLYFCFTGIAKQYHLHDPKLQNLRSLFKGAWDLFKTGFPVGIQLTSEILTLFGITLLSGLHGRVSLGATQIALQYLILMMIPLGNGAQVAGIFVRQAEQKQQSLAAQRYGHMGILLGGILATVFAGVIFCAAPSLSKIFIKKSDSDAHTIHSIATTLLYITAASQMPDTLRYSCVAALRGLQDLKFATVVSITCIVILTLGTGTCFDFALGWGAKGLFLGRLLNVNLATGLMGWRWHQKSKALTADETDTPNTNDTSFCTNYLWSKTPKTGEAKPLLLKSEASLNQV